MNDSALCHTWPETMTDSRTNMHRNTYPASPGRMFVFDPPFFTNDSSVSQSDPRWVWLIPLRVSLSPHPRTLMTALACPLTPAWVTSPCADRSRSPQLSSLSPAGLPIPLQQDRQSYCRRRAVLSYAKLTIAFRITLWWNCGLERY